MPSGKTHTRLNIVALFIAVTLLVLYGATSRGVLLLFAVGFMFGTYFLTPDLDTKSSAYRLWGPLRFLWYPYRAVMPHRSVLTHTIVLGDVIRIAYLLIIMSPLLYALNRSVLDGRLIQLAFHHKGALIVAAAGIIAASALHIAADILDTKRKRVFRRKRR